MSSNLCWEPADRKVEQFSTAIKFALRKRFGEPIKGVILTAQDIDYIQGLFDGGVEGAGAVRSAIEKFGSIELNEVY